MSYGSNRYEDGLGKKGEFLEEEMGGGLRRQTPRHPLAGQQQGLLSPPPFLLLFLLLLPSSSLPPPHTGLFPWVVSIQLIFMDCLLLAFFFLLFPFFPKKGERKKEAKLLNTTCSSPHTSGSLSGAVTAGKKLLLSKLWPPLHTCVVYSRDVFSK